MLENARKRGTVVLVAPLTPPPTLTKENMSLLSQANSYCPISILSVVSKIIEWLIQTQIPNHINNAQLFHPNHHAYRILGEVQMFCYTNKKVSRGNFWNDQCISNPDGSYHICKRYQNMGDLLGSLDDVWQLVSVHRGDTRRRHAKFTNIYTGRVFQKNNLP